MRPGRPTTGLTRGNLEKIPKRKIIPEHFISFSFSFSPGRSKLFSRVHLSDTLTFWPEASLESSSSSTSLQRRHLVFRTSVPLKLLLLLLFFLMQWQPRRRIAEEKEEPRPNKIALTTWRRGKENTRGIFAVSKAFTQLELVFVFLDVRTTRAAATFHVPFFSLYLADCFCRARLWRADRRPSLCLETFSPGSFIADNTLQFISTAAWRRSVR